MAKIKKTNRRERDWLDWVETIMTFSGFIACILTIAFVDGGGIWNGLKTIGWGDVLFSAVVAGFVFWFAFLIRKLVNRESHRAFKDNHDLIINRLDNLEENVPDDLVEQLNSFSKNSKEIKDEIRKLASSKDVVDLKTEMQKMEEFIRDLESKINDEILRREDLLRIFRNLHIYEVKFIKYIRSGDNDSVDRASGKINEYLEELEGHLTDGKKVEKIKAKRILDE